MQDKDKDSLKQEILEGSGIMEAVGVAVFNSKNQILLGKRLTKAGFGTWHMPGGHLKANETIEDCARREIREELGPNFDVEITRDIVAVRENCIAPHHIHHLSVFVKGVHKAGEPVINEPDKCEKWGWFDLDNLPSPLFSGEKEILSNYRKGIKAVVSDW